MFLFILISGSRIAQKTVASASNNIVCFFHFLVTQAMVHYVFKKKKKKKKLWCINSSRRSSFNCQWGPAWWNIDFNLPFRLFADQKIKNDNFTTVMVFDHSFIHIQQHDILHIGGYLHDFARTATYASIGLAYYSKLTLIFSHLKWELYVFVAHVT